MIGQEKLLKKVDAFTLENMPKQIMFIGESGCGKHTIVNHIAQNLKLKVTEISPDISSDLITEYMQSPTPAIYLVNLTLFNDKQQNRLLKIIEEPSKNMYIICIAESEVNILNTILNRCIKYHFEQYSENELRELNWIDKTLDEIAYKICHTPGEIATVASADKDAGIRQLYNLCNTIIKKVNLASFDNTMSIASQIVYGKKNEPGIYDFNLFFETLLYASKEDYLSTGAEQSLKIYELTSRFKQELIGKNIVKENFMLNFLSRLWNEVR